FLAHRMAVADWTAVGKTVRLRACGALVGYDAKNLRNDVARTLDDHRVADPQILAGDLVLIVKRRVDHDDTADRHRFQPRDRRKRAGTAHLNIDRSQPCPGLLRRKLVGGS